MKIYTKGGDKGETSLFGGRRIYKDNIRIEAYGTVDELNSFIGLLAASLTDQDDIQFLLNTQSVLFNCGSLLAADPLKEFNMPKVKESDIIAIENSIDNMTSQLKPLKTFILPGGSVEISYAHLCRTICRRAERRVISLSKEETVDPIIIKYLNRLSDFFFTLSRKIAKDQGHPDIPWIPET
jgi:cob(I)alamin adenosyltransferase